MFVRIKRSVHNGATYEYLQVVESFRDAGRPRQRVLATLGRRDLVVASGALDGLLRSLGKFSETLRVVEAVRTQGMAAHSAKTWGPALVFGRLWEQQGLPAIIERLTSGRRFEFDPERVSFAMALQRLCCPGSDLQGSGWVETVEAPGLQSIALQQLYRTNGFLAAVRDDLELALFERDRDLFTRQVDLVFLDTTSVFVYRAEETVWRKRGYSRDHRPELPQLVLAVAVDQQGWPVSWEVFPGQTADQVALAAMVAKMRERFRIRQVIVVADRGMISKRTLELLTTHRDASYGYILGCRMRRQTEVNHEVLGRAGRYQPVSANLKVKEVRVADRRYIVCLNEEEALKDAAAREAMLQRLRATLATGGTKSLVRNRGYARLLTLARGSVRIDEQAVAADARLDGKFVLTTNTALPADEVAQTYKSLWRVERTFREQKSTLEIRPIFHHRDDTCIGHIVAGFLALRLEVDLHRRLEAKGVEVSWPTLMRELGQVQAVRVTVDGRDYLMRTDLRGSAHHAFVAAGIRPPSPVTLLG